MDKYTQERDKIKAELSLNEKQFSKICETNRKLETRLEEIKLKILLEDSIFMNSTWSVKVKLPEVGRGQGKTTVDLYHNGTKAEADQIIKLIGTGWNHESVDLADEVSLYINDGELTIQVYLDSEIACNFIKERVSFGMKLVFETLDKDLMFLRDAITSLEEMAGMFDK